MSLEGYYTPLKKYNESPEKQISYFSTDKLDSLKIDYKAKTFELIKLVTQYQLRDKKQNNHILKLERDLEILNLQMNKILQYLQAHNLQEVIQKLRKTDPILKQKQNLLLQKQLTDIIAQYKKLLSSQQYHYLILQQQYKKNEIKLFKMQQYNRLERKKKEQFKLELQQVKKNYQKLKQQNESLQQLKSKIQNKYHDQIIQFQDLEKNVQLKLKQVHQQMILYQKERSYYEKQIQGLKKQLQVRQLKQYFSFGGTQAAQTQTQQTYSLTSSTHKEEEQLSTRQNQQFIRDSNNQQTEYGLMSYQCFEASIKTLLEQNARLKQALLMLHKNKGEQLPKQTELEIKILLSMLIKDEQ